MEGTWCRKEKFEQGRCLALSNRQAYHLTAYLYRGQSLIKMGTNTEKTHPRYIRTYKSGHCGAELHAEMSVLTRAKPGDTLVVFRWTKDGCLNMSHPCEHCMTFIRQAGIKKVIYSDWDGQIKTFKVEKHE